MMRTLTLAAATCGLLAFANPGLAFGETEQKSYGAGGLAQTGRNHDAGNDDNQNHDGSDQNAEAGYGRGWSGDRDGQWRGRGGDRQERRGAGPGPRTDRDGDGQMAGNGPPQGGWHAGQGTHVMLTTGSTRLAVMCGPRETLRDCVEAATLLLDRAARVPAAPAGTGSTAPPAAGAPKAP